MTDERFAKLPHDEWYDDDTWAYIIDGPDYVYPEGYRYPGAPEFDPTQVTAVVHWHVDEGDYGPEHNAVGVFAMSDGTFTVYTGWCDTTGWGCQDDARFTNHPTYEHAVRFGMGDENRRWLGIDL